jgi:hypothetical protein
MAEYEVGRSEVLTALTRALEPLDYVHALWEAGAVSFGRVDMWSDIDLQTVVEDQRVEETFDVIEESLDGVSGIDVRYRLPEPTWHGHAQAFYRLNRASPFLLLDLVVMKASSDNRFLQPAIHGFPHVYFDKTGAVRFEPFDTASFAESIRSRKQELAVLFDMFGILTLKEVNRGNDIEAHAFYQAYTLRPLLQLLRTIHDPTRHNFHTRYVHYNLPSDDVERLRRLIFVRDIDDLKAKHAEAERWFRELMARNAEGPFTEDLERALARSKEGASDA